MPNLISAPWIAWQAYEDNDFHFIVISNALLHTFGVIEGHNANLWIDLFKDKNSRHCCPKSSEQNLDFINLLLDEGIITENLDINTDHGPSPTEPPTPIFLTSEASLQDLEYVALEEDIKNRVGQIGKLWTFFWETTYLCNEKCTHCFNPGASHGHAEKSSRSSLTLERPLIKRLLDDLREVGVFRIVFSGGEFFVHEDWEYILEQAHKRNFEIHIFTNGLLLDDKKLERVCKYWPQSVSISIYSHIPEVHDKITRTPFSHEYSLKALRSLRERGIKTTIKCPIMNTSADDIAKIAELAKSLGARIAFDAMISAGNDGNSSPVKHNSNWTQLLRLALDPISPTFVGNEETNYGMISKDMSSHVCGAGRSIMSLTPDGRITPCCALPITVGDLHEKSFRSIWESCIENERIKDIGPLHDEQNNDLLSEWRATKLQDYEECGTHERCAWCNKCPGAGLNENGDVLQASEVQCKIADARMSVANLLRKGLNNKEILGMIENSEIKEPSYHL